jgi:predicted nucleotidyltransferase
MNIHNAWRLELARQVAPAYAAHPHVRAVFVFGSVGRGWADEYSDIELGAIWSQPPTEEALKTIAESIRVSGRVESSYLEAKQSWSNMYYVQGVRFETAHWTQESIENIIDDVILRFDVSQNFLLFEKQALLAVLQSCVVLDGEELIENWRRRIAVYPEELVVAMVQKHLRFSPFGSREMLAQRNEIPLLYENHNHSIRLLLNLLCGLNRIYHPTFKWTCHLIDEMTIAPPQLFTRMENVYRAAPVEGTRELRCLIEEAFVLVETHLPAIDLTEQRRTFNEPYESWSTAPQA